MNDNNSTPYSTLTPDLILDAIEQAGFACNGSLLPLNSYENRVYQIGLEDAEPIIAKLYRPNRWSNESILEEHQFSLELVSHEIPVIAPWMNDAEETLHQHQGFRFALFPRKGGRALELDRLEQLEWMGRFIGRLHAVGAARPFQHRPALTVQTHGHDAYRLLLDRDFVPSHLKTSYCSVVETVLQKIEYIYERVGNIHEIRLHGDIHAGNVLWRDTGPHIVDLDDCVMGPAVQDIWMLLSGDTMQMNTQLEHILRGYRAFYDFNPRELHLIEALRTLRMLQYSAWLASRWEDPAFPLSFPWFNTAHYWQEQVQNLSEQIELLDAI
jgi:Ser/Thr protein kinase RdoA (MazF antagonist)